MEITRQTATREVFLARIISRRILNNINIVNNEARLEIVSQNQETQDELDNSAAQSEISPKIRNTESFPDFRIYPLKIDWREVEKGKSFAYEAMEEFGFLGVSIFTRLIRLNKFDLNYKKIPLEVLEIYSRLQKETDYVSAKKLKCLIEELPSISDLENLLLSSYITNKEVFLYKLLLDIYYHYSTTIDFNRQCQFKILSMMEFLINDYLGLEEFEALTISLESLFIKKIYRSLNLSAINLMSYDFVKRAKQSLYLVDLKDDLLL